MVTQIPSGAWQYSLYFNGQQVTGYRATESAAEQARRDDLRIAQLFADREEKED